MEVILEFSKNIMLSALKKLLAEWIARCDQLADGDDKKQLSESIKILSTFIKTLELK